MRIAVVTNRFPALSETFIYEKVKGLAKAGCEVRVFIHDRDHDASFFGEDPFLKKAGVKIVPAVGGGAAGGCCKALVLRPLACLKALALSFQESKNFMGALKAWIKALPYIPFRFDVIHFEFSGIAVRYRAAFILLRPARLYFSCRGSAEKLRLLVDPKRAAELQSAFEGIDRIHCVSEDMLRTLEPYGIPKEKVFINRPAIDGAYFSRKSPFVEDGVLRLITVGRLSWQKGYVFALLALKKAKLEGARFHYEIVGGGPADDELSYLVKAFNLEAEVSFAGRASREAVREKLEKCHVFLLPSVYEGISNAALEAMSMEVPVVSTRAGGMEEVIEHGRNGFLTPCCDPDELAGLILRLSRNRQDLKKNGAAGRAVVQKEHTVAAQISRYMKEYGA